MASVEDVLNAAEGELGYYAPDDPEPGSKYGRWMAEVTGEGWLRGPSSSVWWCCCFVSWCLDAAGQECDGFPSYNTDTSVGGAGDLLVDVGDAQAGDILIFDWNFGTAATDHVGFVTERVGEDVVETIEGNVGNAVARRTRSLSTVRYVIRPPYDGEGCTCGDEGDCEDDGDWGEDDGWDDCDDGGLEVDGWLGSLSVAAWQRAISDGAADGVVSGQARVDAVHIERVTSVTWEADGESALARSLQRRVGAGVDGFIGEETVGCLQRWLGAHGHELEDDGYLGPVTACAVQRSLNDGEW